MNNTLQINIEANESYEKRNLSYMYIKDLDFSTTPVSFYRSDFREQSSPLLLLLVTTLIWLILLVAHF